MDPTRRDFLGAAGALPLLGALRGRRPSWLVVVADQLTWWMTEPGQRGVLELDSIDRLRAEGTSFSRCYATSPVCAAARVSLRTGLWVHRNPGAESLLADTPTVEERMRDLGYTTHYIGKWHLSPGNGTTSGYVLPQWRPDWDSFVGHEVNHSAHLTFEGNDPTPIHTGEWDTGTMTDYALERIRAEALADRPFYMQLNYLSPHQPYADYPSWLAVYDQGDPVPRPNVPVPSWPDFLNVGMHYMNSTRGVDLELGRLLDELDRLGIEVVVVFTSDHGDLLHSHGQTFKRSPLEESARVPLIVRGPGWRAGATLDHPVGLVDLASTICGLGQGLHLRERRDSTYFEMNQAAASWMQGRWRGVATDDGWKLAVSENGPRLLSDLASDPYELVNLAGQGHPQEDALLARMHEWAHETADDFFG